MFRAIGLDETAKRIEEEEVVGDDLVDFEDEDLEAFEIPKSIHDVLKGHAGGGTERFIEVTDSSSSSKVEEEETAPVAPKPVAPKSLIKKKKEDTSQTNTKKKNDDTQTEKKKKERDRTLTTEQMIVQTVTRRIGGSTGKEIPSAKGFSVNDEVEITFGKRSGQKATLLKLLKAKVSEPTVCRWLVKLENGKKVRYPETKLDQVGSSSSSSSERKLRKHMKVRALKRVKAKSEKHLDLRKGDQLQIMKISASDDDCFCMHTKSWKKGLVSKKVLAPL